MSSGPDEVVVVDELRLRAADADGWLTRWRRDYLPAARERGLRLVAVARGATRHPGEVAVVIHWSIDSIDRFWAARVRATADPAVAAFWAETDAIALRRDRRVLATEVME